MPNRRPGEKQVRDVRAADEQDERDGTEELLTVEDGALVLRGRDRLETRLRWPIPGLTLDWFGRAFEKSVQVIPPSVVW